MTEQDVSRYQDLIVTTATDVGIKILAAIVFWVIGRWCEFRPKLDSDSDGTWTLIPRQAGH